MIYRYTPTIRWKRGERSGLSLVSIPGKTDVIPLILLDTEHFRERSSTRSRVAVSASDAFAAEIQADWGTTPFYLDAVNLVAHGAVHPLFQIAQSCRAANLHLIPATSLSAPAIYQAAVGQVLQSDQRGVALRIDLQQMTSANQWVSKWTVPLNQTDLIIDLMDSVVTVNALGSVLTNAFQSLHMCTSWRTITVTGTSMPGNFSGYLAGQHFIPRAEFQIWQQLTNSNLPYRLNYGDYTTVPLVPPPAGIAWGYPINVRYTLPTEFMICRGVGTTGINGVDMDVQLLGHAQSIASYTNRNIILCYGDDTINQIAARQESPGNLEKWVKIGINRHIELVRSQLP